LKKEESFALVRELEAYNGNELSLSYQPDNDIEEAS
jgi:hypothetical protein